MAVWIGEAIEKIGAYKQFEKKTVDTHFDNYISPLPSDVYRLSQVSYSNDGRNWVPMVVGSSTFVMPETTEPSGDTFVQDSEYVKLVMMLYDITDISLALALLNSNPNIRTVLDTLLQNGNYSVKDIYTVKNLLKYELNNNMLKFNIKDGYLRIVYLGMQVDEDGLPMIPDMDEYREALYRYCTMKLYYPKYLNGSMNMGVYQDMQGQWAWARNNAYAAAMMPGVDDLEAIKNNWVRLFPEINAHSEFFETLGDQQLILNR
jgi:hypothetical protein